MVTTAIAAKDETGNWELSDTEGLSIFLSAIDMAIDRAAQLILDLPVDWLKLSIMVSVRPKGIWKLYFIK